MRYRKIQCNSVLGRVAVGEYCMLELFHPSKHVSPAGMERCPQLLQQLVYGRVRHRARVFHGVPDRARFPIRDFMRADRLLCYPALPGQSLTEPAPHCTALAEIS